MKFKCIHISDIHFRGLKRHEEYRKVFKTFFEKAKNLLPDVIYVGGDIVHSKTQGITPELIDELTNWFNSLAEIAPVHVILGNHDGLILNEDRQDAVTPIINAINNENIFLYKKSGTYSTGVKGVNWCVFSCFDENAWYEVKPVEGEINIALYHGGVLGSTTDLNWEINGEVELEFFDKFDFAMLGDIHKFQYLDTEKRIAYPGSPIQQNFGEDVKKGFLFWEINSKNDYSSKFIELENDHPFLTLEWKGNTQDTLDFYKDIKSNARLRISSKEEIAQYDIQELHKELKTNKKPIEITYKIDVEKNSFSYNNVVKNNLDIKNDADRFNLIKGFFSDAEDEEVSRVSSIYSKMLDRIGTETSKYENWQINKMKFNNTFSYGKENEINFDNMSGIVGIFGKNRTGKSSIPGTLMYGLFNTSDRGPLKNIHIINSRKGSCDAEIHFTVDDNRYSLIRSTKKKESKKGVVSATTKLEVYRLDSDGLKINESEEQRRETEKVVKGLLGNSEDFLYTGFASQGSLNSFIEEKSTARKNILTKFLDLNIFDELYSESRDEYAVIKDKIKKASEKSWTSLIREAKSKIEEIKSESLELETKIEDIQEEILNLKTKENILKSNNKRHKSGLTYDECISIIETLKTKLKRVNSENEDIKVNVENNNKVLEKISNLKNQFPIEALETEKSRLESLTNNLNRLSYTLKSKKEESERLNNSLNVLEDIPCENKFTSCKFIKDANVNKQRIPVISEEISTLNDEINEVLYAAESIKEKDIENKINKYNSALKKEYKLGLDNKAYLEKIESNNQTISSIESDITLKESILAELKLFTSKNNIHEIKVNEEKIRSLQFDLRSINDEKNYLIQQIGSIKSNIENWEAERKDFEKVSEEWKYFEMFLKSIGKKGIPSLLINTALPSINKEIKNILSGIVNFNVTIEPDNNNNLDIFINYGDSKRLIECCSGMEKMMSSIAIRVALINISNLAKPNIFIIDEGFGALDSYNVETCTTLMRNLKSYFKTILIISHVDSIKESADSIIEITSKGKDSYVKYV